MPTYSLCIGGCLGGPPKPPVVHPINKKRAVGSLSKGTTTSAFIFNGGVIVAAEHQRELSNRSVPNVVILNSHMVASITGGSEFLLKDLQKKCHLHELAKGRRTSVAEASEWLAETLSFRSEESLSVGVLIAGWEETGPVLYHVDNKGKIQDCRMLRDIFQEVHECAVVATGSAGGYARSILGSMTYYNMSVDEAVSLGEESICVGAWLLSSEGGEVANGNVVSVYHIGNTGWKKHVSAHDIEDYQKKNISSHPEYKPDEESAQRYKSKPNRLYICLEEGEGEGKGKAYVGPILWSGGS